MRIIGSGAAEAIPDPLCVCPICENARRAGGREVRSRACFRVDDATQIDFGPDTFYQSVVLGNDLRGLRQLLITHSHEDHLAFAEFGLKAMAVDTHPEPLRVYLSRPAHEWLLRAGAPYGYETRMQRFVTLCPVMYGQPFAAGDLRVLPLAGNHWANGRDERSLNYHITFPDGATLYYAVDTGYFLPETFERLKEVHVDTLVMEATFGDAPSHAKPETDGHLGVAGVLAVTERLYRQGTLGAGSRVFLTHVNHKHTLTYRRMAEWFARHPAPVPITVGYDGMDIPA